MLGHLRLAWSIILSCDPLDEGSDGNGAMAPGGASELLKLPWFALTFSKNVLPERYSFAIGVLLMLGWLMGGGG